MSTEKRRIRDKEEMKELILSAATEIIAEEGIDNLSIRKIAGRMGYSPSLIYHYFKDKNEILNIVMQRGYRKIISAVSQNNINEDPKDLLKSITRGYIESALKMPDEFMAAQINKSPEASKYTASLFKGASNLKPALKKLFLCLKDINKDSEVDEDKLELTAQVIAVSTLGLIIKLILEQDIGEVQRQRLIEHYLEDSVLKIARISKKEGDQ